MSFKHRASVYHHIFTRAGTTASILILSTLQANPVIPHIESRVYNQGILTRFQIQAVTILRIARITHLHFFNQYIFTHQRMQIPRRRILKDNPLQPYILTLYQAHHHRPKKMTHALPFFLRRQVLRYIHIADRISFQCLRIREPISGPFVYSPSGYRLFPNTFRYFFPFQRTPKVSIPVNGPLSGDSYIRQVTSRNRRLTPAGIQSFKNSFNQRIKLHIRREKHYGPFLYVKIDITFQHNRTGQPDTCRHNQVSASARR